ncbi:histone-lysine N-methyltransferase, H3 lysine-9 specific SUVH5-like [Primulina tabacum]|uniref:histone-lysine N-methyltransferase, H3 lysine-9 specific SUVH5-like n=1 Tax=Primulina tabacum TaxID=48773 RepID=UPI003F59E23B
MKFEEHYEALKKERKERKAEMGEGQKCKSYAHIEAAERVKAEGMCISVQNPFGHIPGIEIGDTFRFRAQLVVVGLHRQMMSGIDYVTIGGEKFATCVVDSGRYENEAKTNDSLIYSGQGGNPKFVEKAADQKLIRGNLAMANSMDMGYPVRVIRKRMSAMRSYGFGHSNDSKYLFVYDGLYAVTKYWQERDQNGLETLKIRAMNGIDDLRPPPFSYINKIIYPNWYRRVEPIGCNCINGCSDSRQCSCVVRNGGEIPFNEKGSIVRSRTIVYECGPNCKCPPSCMNRVSQRPPRIQLEIFKTKERGWGVRTRDYVTSGSFICANISESCYETRKPNKELAMTNTSLILAMVMTKMENPKALLVQETSMHLLSMLSLGYLCDAFLLLYARIWVFPFCFVYVRNTMLRLTCGDGSSVPHLV